MTAHSDTPTAPPLADRELLAALRDAGPRHEQAVAELHALLLRAARFELGRRAAQLDGVRGEERDDLALQAADDAFVAILAKLDQFRGDSRFTTWAYKFALYEAAVRVRLRAWQHREVVLDPDRWLAVAAHGPGPAEHQQQAELLAAVRTAIATRLTRHQREVLVALAIDGIPIDVLADRRGTTRGALYKTLHDARRRLRAELAAAGHDLEALAP